MTTYPHRLSYRIRLASGSDDRAPGGAVTVALCGHWDHEGPCRWPHLSTIASDGEGLHRLVVEFDASAEDMDTVTSRIETAVAKGQLTGPDGCDSFWKREG